MTTRSSLASSSSAPGISSERVPGSPDQQLLPPASLSSPPSPRDHDHDHDHGHDYGHWQPREDDDEDENGDNIALLERNPADRPSDHPERTCPDLPSWPPAPPKPSRTKEGEVSEANQAQFSAWTLVIETLPPLLLSVVGGVLTGELLEKVQSWPAFVRVPELFILLPVLMNLKGNLEMNLAARLSTSANVGDLDTPGRRRALVAGNLTLLQVQALIVSFFASMLAFVLGLLSRHNLPSIRIPPKPGKSWGWQKGLEGGYYECLLVLAAGMLAASVNSALLGGLMCGLVILCRLFRVNPDNITTPVASSLGDLLTLVFLSLAASVLVRYANTLASTVVFGLLVCTVGLHAVLTLRNAYVQRFLRVGWVPMFVAMLISTCTGLVLESVVSRFGGFATIAPVLTGISGNIGTVALSRRSTALHAQAVEPGRTVAAILLVMSTIILAGFAFWSSQVGPDPQPDMLFFAGFMLCSLFCSSVSLILANVLSTKLWEYGYDPDVYAIPILSSLVDLIGQVSLVATFVVFKWT